MGATQKGIRRKYSVGKEGWNSQSPGSGRVGPGQRTASVRELIISEDGPCHYDNPLQQHWRVECSATMERSYNTEFALIVCLLLGA